MESVTVPWPPVPDRLPLSAGEVHLVAVPLEVETTTVAALSETLCAEERRRADKFHFPRDRDHYIVCRGRLRALLARYLDAAPAEIEFSYGPHGKPALAAGAGLFFNVSHSGDLAIYAVAGDREVGVDVERLREVRDLEQISARFFSENERRALMELPVAERRRAFFRCWTCKEAFIKASGEGLSFPLDQFDVSLAAAEPARLLSLRGDAQEALRWSLLVDTPAQGYVAALAALGPPPQVVRWRWN